MGGKSAMLGNERCLPDEHLWRRRYEADAEHRGRSIVADGGSVIDRGSYAHETIEIVQSLFVRNQLGMDLSANGILVRDSVWAYNQEGLKFNEWRSSNYTIQSTLFLGNDISFYASTNTQVENVIFYKNKVTIQSRTPRSTDPPYLCTTLARVTLIRNTVGISSTVPLNADCGGVIKESNFLESQQAHMVYTGREVAFNVTNIYWGTTNTDEIRAQLLHVFVDPSLGAVEIEPISMNLYPHSMYLNVSAWEPPESFLGVPLVTESSSSPSTSPVAPMAMPTVSPILFTGEPTVHLSLAGSSWAQTTSPSEYVPNQDAPNKSNSEVEIGDQREPGWGVVSV
eukprot:scaffold34685_cov183-Amphora_coffeaeformis.AAC.9